MEFKKDEITDELAHYVDIDIKATIIMARNDYLTKHNQEPEPYIETLKRLAADGEIDENEIPQILQRIKEKEMEEPAQN